MDGRMYARAWQGGILSGGLEKNPKPIFTEGRNQLEVQNMQEDWDHFGKEDRLLIPVKKKKLNGRYIYIYFYKHSKFNFIQADSNKLML